VGLIGFGCVGQGFYDLIRQLPALGIEVARIAVKTSGKIRSLPTKRFEFDADALVSDPTLDLLVEVIDDAEEALRLVSAALRLGRRVVTANKAMLARHLGSLLRLEAEYGGTLLYEAAVAGSIPVLRTLDAHFGGEPLQFLRGIINGSSNYVLSRMVAEGSDYATALAEAQQQGFAETDPALDMAGFDPRSKAVLLAAHGFGLLVHPERVLNLGIENISPADIAFAAGRGRKIKLVAELLQLPDGQVSLAVLPRLLAADSPLYAVEREFNGIEVGAAFAGTQFFQGRGAGGHPTGSAVLADVLAARQGFRYGYAKLHEGQATQLATELQAEVYLRHPTAQGLAELANTLGLQATIVPGQRAATGVVRLDALLARRDALREAGVFVAALGSARPAFAPVSQLLETEAV